jgi:hypothetical protein
MQSSPTYRTRLCMSLFATNLAIAMIVLIASFALADVPQPGVPCNQGLAAACSSPCTIVVTGQGVCCNTTTEGCCERNCLYYTCWIDPPQSCVLFSQTAYSTGMWEAGKCSSNECRIFADD